MKLINLGSGSKGNATLIEYSSNKYILIDCGLSSFEKLLKENNIDINSIDFVFVTHNHGDHILNIEKFPSGKIYSGKETINIPHNEIKYYKEYVFPGFKVLPLKTSHDAPNSFGFLFTINNIDIVYITDSGKIPAKTERFLFNKNIYIFESNYELELLRNSGRPLWLQKRISSSKGHLSNVQALEYLKKYIGEDTKAIFLAHISEECNSLENVIKVIDNLNVKEKSYFNQWKETVFYYDEN